MALTKLVSTSLEENNVLGFDLYRTNISFAAASQVVNEMAPLMGNVLSQQTYPGTGDQYAVVNTTTVRNSFEQVLGEGPIRVNYTGDGPLVISFYPPTSETTYPLSQNGTGIPAHGGYGRICRFPRASIVFEGASGGDSTSGNVQRSICEHGEYISYSIDRGSMHIFILKDGTIYVCPLYNAVATQWRVGRLVANSSLLALVATGPSNCLYVMAPEPRSIHGVVKDAAGAPAAGCVVRLYDRSTGQLLAQQTTNAAGEYDMAFVAQIGAEVYLVCLDDDVAPDFEPVAVDRIVIQES